MSQKLALTFRIFKNDQLLREDTLVQGVIKIGKVPSAHLRIDDDSVSRMHAIVEVIGGDISLIDLGSTRGTFVNGRKINKAKLQSGDVITLGDTRVEFAVASAAPAPGPALPLASTSTALLPRPTAELAIAGPLAPAPPAIPAAALRFAPAPPAIPAAELRSAPAPSLWSATPAAGLHTPPTTAVLAPGTAAHAVYLRAGAESVDESGGARAVEVAAMLGDTVIAVKHCMDPRSGKVAAATWGMVAASMACLLASAIAFTVSVSNAAHNERNLDAWTGTQHKPAHAFRPRRLGVAVDWIAFGGLALGLAGLTSGLVRARRERIHPYYRIGTAPGVELAVENAPSAAFPLVAPSGDDFVFNYGAGIDGELIIDGKSTPLAELATAGRSRPSAAIAGAIEVPIPPSARIRARAGQTTFVVSSVARPGRYATSLFASLDNRTLSYVAGSLGVHLAILGLLQLIPPDASSVSVTPGSHEATGMRSATIARIEPPPDEIRERGAESGDDSEAAPMELPSGATGNPEAKQADGRMQVARTQDQPQLSRDAAIEVARREGILGSDGIFSGVRVLGATSDFSSGFDLTNVNGPIYGSDGEGGTNFGGGVRGFDVGGGCIAEPCGIIGMHGRYDTINSGVHAGDNFKFPRSGGPGGSGRNPILPRIGDPTTSGPTYDKSIVRRYVRRHINEIGYCYDKQLLAHPGIQGAITVTFLISPMGNVQTASATGFDPEVSSCLAGIIKTIEFPAPREGGVQVNYPFHFRASGQ